MTRWMRLFLCLMLAVGLVGCGVKKENKGDAPAGSPDELKDSTRFDAAPDTPQVQPAAPDSVPK